MAEGIANNSIGRISLGGNSGHETMRRTSSCQDFGGVLGGIPNSSSFHLDPLFQIDEKKKYLGFLEESTDEEKSNSDCEINELDSNKEEQEDSEREDESCANFFAKLDSYQRKVNTQFK